MSRFLPFLLMILFIVSNSSCMGAPVFVEVTVLTEAGEPVNNARITYKFLGNTRDVDYGTTNRFGRDTEIGFGGRGVEFRVEKDGYYATAGSIGRNDTKVTAVLRERVNPIAMYVKEARMLSGMNLQNEWVGYDLFVGDYLPPLGVGSVADFEITNTRDRIDANNYTVTLSICFPNEGDGLIGYFSDKQFSQFISNYHVPKNGNYTGSWDYIKVREGGENIEETFERFREYYFRIRSQYDEQGNLVSAHYGKIYGEFPNITHYINPTPNDTNVEFDPKQNLFTNLKNDEKVWEP